MQNVVMRSAEIFMKKKRTTTTTTATTTPPPLNYMKRPTKRNETKRDRMVDNAESVLSTSRLAGNISNVVKLDVVDVR